MPCPSEEDPAFRLLLDFPFIPPGEFLMCASRRFTRRAIGETALNLLPEEHMVEIHRESPSWSGLDTVLQR